MTFELQACRLKMVNVEFERATSNVLSSESDVAFERYRMYVCMYAEPEITVRHRRGQPFLVVV